MIRLISAALFALMLLTACSNISSVQNNGSNSFDQSNQNDTVTRDSLEKYNRYVFIFNAGLDNLFFKSAAMAYKAVTPRFVDNSTRNFFRNLDDVSNAINNLLQLKVDDAINDTERFVFNSTFGMVGLFDVASEAGLEKHEEDFGQTLAHWGVGSGSYVMLPFLGPSTVRDAIAKLSVDRFTNPTYYSDEDFSFFIVERLNKRAGFLKQEGAFKELSDDQYSALRDAWLQRRDYLIRDGKDDQNSSSDLIDELESLESE